jgi:phosphate starvation-inducible protein PhoH and related proteins
MSKKQKKTDNSPAVVQREKLKSTLPIKEFPWTDKQKEFIDIALDKETKIVFVSGPAGTAKTLLSVYCGLKMLSDHKHGELIYIRSAVESSDAKLGYLPGTVDDKLAFYALPLADKLHELLPMGTVNALLNDGRVKMFPVNFARGLTWRVSTLIFDEMQNSSLKEIITLLTRIGKFSKCFILADPDQTDLAYSKGGGFEKLLKVFGDEESSQNGIRTFSFNEDDILRSDLVKFIVKKVKNVK